MTKDEAIELLDNLIGMVSDSQDNDYDTALKMAIEALEQNRWILRSERLPKQNGVYIVTRAVSDGFEYRNITDACYFDGSNVWHDDTRVNHGREYLTDVIAWMPLPEPWEGEQNERHD